MASSEAETPDGCKAILTQVEMAFFVMFLLACGSMAGVAAWQSLLEQPIERIRQMLAP